MFSASNSIILLLLVYKIVISSSSSNVFMIPEVPKLNLNVTKLEKQKAESLSLLEKSLELKLKAIRNEELGAPIVQEIVDSWTFSENIINDSVLIEKISNSISEKLNPAIKIIKEICSFLTNKDHKRQTFYSLMNPCPNDDKIDAKISHFYNEIYQNLSGELNIDLLNDRNLIFHNYLIENVGNADRKWQSYRQYFLSSSDHGKIENCNYVPDIFHFTKLYSSAIMNKRIILLIDQTSEQMDTTRSVAKTVIAALNKTDKVSVILIADKVTIFSRPDSCENEVMAPATPTIKHKIYDFLDSVNRTNGIANHTLGFQVAFDILNQLYKESTNNELLPISFLYISEGITDLFADARNVLAEITIGQSRLPHPVVINICAIVANNRQFPAQAQFLHDIASQNFVKYGLDTSVWWHRKGDRSLNGQMFLMNRTMERFQRNLLLCLTELFRYKPFINNQVTLHQPYFDNEFSNDFIVSLTKTCDQRGIFGVDLFLNFLIEDVLYSNQLNSSYKFLTDLNGNTYAHSLLYPRPVTLKESFHPVNIRLLETTTGFDNLWERMRSQQNGSMQLENWSYTWRHVSNLMIVCIVTDVNESSFHKLRRIKGSNTHMIEKSKFLPELIYHRMDLLIPPTTINMCHYYKQVVTFDAITLHLSSKAFSSPYSHIRSNKPDDNDDMQAQIAQNYMAYLRDTRNLFANPGLLDGIRNEVSGVYQIMEFLKAKHIDSELKKYAIRRYVATMNGVLQVFPGCALDVNFEATRRPWFVKAMQAKGELAVTEPYLDAGGAGYVVSVSYLVFERKRSTNGKESKQPIAVASLDFTRGFFYKLLLDESPDCGVDSIKCFIMNDKGFLIAHPNVLESINDHHRLPEHITHKESHVANDILMQRKFVKKIACNDYLNGTSQRYYQFNTSITEVITNFANVEKTKYQIMSVKETNLFVGIINSTSETSGAFCPCSTIDFRCLNCYRMEQIECECPCECRLDDDDTCATNKSELSTESSSCPQQTEYIQSYQAPIVKDVVDSCNLFNCDLFTEREDCLGVIGCIW